MKILTVAALVCAIMVLDRAAAWTPHHQIIVKTHLITRVRLCPRGWSRFCGRCFRFVPRLMTWAGAEKNCQLMGGNLASVHNLREYRKLQRLVLKSMHQYKQAWIGGSDAQEERQWFWSDGTPFNYQNWCPREPNNFFGRQNCLHINHGAGKCWDDVQCYRQAPSICARKARRFLG